MKPFVLVRKIFAWRLRHVNNRQFVLVLSLVVGLLSGLAAVVFKNTLYYTNYFLTNGFNFSHYAFLYLIWPLAGVLLTILFVRYVVKDNIGHGISKVLYSISRNGSKLRPHNNYSSLVAGTLTLGFGGSVGPEAPIVVTGASIGSNLGQVFRLNYKTMTLLVGCGSAGAISGIFGAPIAGVVFVIEILMLDLTLTTLIPLMISAVTASVLAYLLIGKEVLFLITLDRAFSPADLPFYIFLGVFTGMVSIWFIRASALTEKVLHAMKPMYKYLSGGFLLMLLMFAYPSLFGEGYTALKSVLGGDGSFIGNPLFFGQLKSDPRWFTLILFILILAKVIAMALTQGMGGIGGTFAPALFVGGFSGYFVAQLIQVTTGLQVSFTNFAMVGMAGVMSGVMFAPLTAIFLIAEITGGYALLTPLITVTAIAYLTCRAFERHSIYNRQLAIRKELITHDKDKAAQTMMSAAKLIEKNFNPVHPDQTLGDLVKVIARSSRNIFPVVDEDLKFFGVIRLDDIRQIMFEPEMYQTYRVRDLMYIPPETIAPDDDMEKIFLLFQKATLYNLPVVKDGKYIGFLSRSTVFSQYREMLKQFSEE